MLLSEARAEFPLRQATGCPAGFFANDNAAGYYRSAYVGPWFDRLLAGGMDKLAPQEEAALLQNVQALVAGGKFDARQALALAMRFSGSDDRDVVMASLRIAGGVSQVVPEELASNYARLLRAWLGKRARELGWQPKQGESEDTKMIRLAIVPLVTIGGEDAGLGAEARRLAEAWLKDRNAIDRDTAGLILIAAARQGDRALFDRYVSELRRTGEQRERFLLIGGLGAFRDPDIMRASLGLVLDAGDGLDPREVRSVITSQWRETRPIVWEFVKRNFDELNARLPGARCIPYGATLPSAAGGFCGEARADDLESFFQPRIASLSGGARNLASVVESIRLCSARRVALEAGVRQFLARY